MEPKAPEGWHELPDPIPSEMEAPEIAAYLKECWQAIRAANWQSRCHPILRPIAGRLLRTRLGQKLVDRYLDFCEAWKERRP